MKQLGNASPPEPIPPFLKWAGGKRWLAPLLAPAIATWLRSNPGARYFEPFLGGGAVALSLTEASMVLADAETPVVSAYTAIRDNWPSVWQELEALVRSGTDEANYYKVRTSAPSRAEEAAARLLFLNRTCYNGLYRVNGCGQFNVPYGKYAAPSFPTAAHLRGVSDVLQGASLHAGDFETTLAGCGRHDVVYADPPYYSASTGFRSYHARPFTRCDHERLALALGAAHERGSVVFATNSDEPFIRGIYSWARHVENTSERRAISCVGNNRAASKCLLISSLDLGPA